MKKTVVITLATVATAAVSMGATSVGVANFAFPPSVDNGLAIVDNSGTPLTGVNFGVGTLADGANLVDAESVRAAFTEYASASTTSQFFAREPEGGNVANIADGVSPQDSSPVYVVFYNGENLATAADFIVFEGDKNYLVENPALGLDLDITLTASNLLYGTEKESNNTGVVGPFTAFTNGVTFGAGDVAIPEPSSALLSLVGLAFVARRRR